MAAGAFEGNAKFVVRPEDVCLGRVKQSGEIEDTQVMCRLVRITDCGSYVRAELDGPVHLVSHLSHTSIDGLGVCIGDDVVCIIRSSAIHVLPT